MNNQIDISVLMTVYNTPFDWIKRTIDSVLNQDYQHFELIILDDGSTETNRALLMQYIQQHENKIRYIWHKNIGQSAAINRGVEYARGAYISMLDSDDTYKPNHLSACLLEMTNVDLICSTSETVVSTDDDYYVPDKNDLSQNIHIDNTVLLGTFFGRKGVFETLRFKTGFAADADFYEQAAKQFRVKKANLRTYVYYRNNPASVCALLKKSL